MSPRPTPPEWAYELERLSADPARRERLAQEHAALDAALHQWAAPDVPVDFASTVVASLSEVPSAQEVRWGLWVLAGVVAASLGTLAASEPLAEAWASVAFAHRWAAMFVRVSHALWSAGAVPVTVASLATLGACAFAATRLRAHRPALVKL